MLCCAFTVMGMAGVAGWLEGGPERRPPQSWELSHFVMAGFFFLATLDSLAPQSAFLQPPGELVPKRGDSIMVNKGSIYKFKGTSRRPWPLFTKSPALSIERIQRSTSLVMLSH